jgi:holo-[acyl-carrier protein] synthase
MIVGIGIDMVEISRIRELIDRHAGRARNRLFTPAELDYCNSARDAMESLAVRFAAKEALFKALGTGWAGGVRWHDVEVLPDGEGAPRMMLAGPTAAIARDRGVRAVHVSLSHTRELAAAYVVLEDGGTPG